MGVKFTRDEESEWPEMTAMPLRRSCPRRSESEKKGFGGVVKNARGIEAECRAKGDAGSSWNVIVVKLSRSRRKREIHSEMKLSSE
jgi:hypothetical protein